MATMTVRGDAILDPRHVAEFFLYQESDVDSAPMTQLRLQKLLYYAQGWHLALTGEPLIAEDIEAWQHGPVVPSVYRLYKKYGSQAIPRPPTLPPPFTPETTQVLLDVWASYGKLSAHKLRKMTHREPPWTQARMGYGDRDTCEERISKVSMQQYFIGLLEHQRDQELERERQAYLRQPETDAEKDLAEMSLEVLSTAE